jgi:hypothetical protein
MDIMNFTKDEQKSLFRIIAAILHLGNIKLTGSNSDQAQMNDTSAAERVCHVLGIPVAEFSRGLLRPKIKAGRDWVAQARNTEQVTYSIEALARALYERMFGQLVERINIAMDRPTGKSTFIGVLDIAGFEIFEASNKGQGGANDLLISLYRQIASSNSISIIQMRSCNSFSIIICLCLSKRSTSVRALNGSLLILVWICSRQLI